MRIQGTALAGRSFVERLTRLPPNGQDNSIYHRQLLAGLHRYSTVWRVSDRET
jgi:hypothetical protein